MEGLTSQIFGISETFVRWLIELNVLLPDRFDLENAWRMPGEPQLSEPHPSPVKFANPCPRNALPPSRGTMLTRMPPWPISAESAPVM